MVDHEDDSELRERWGRQREEKEAEKAVSVPAVRRLYRRTGSMVIEESDVNCGRFNFVSGRVSVME